MLRIENSAFSPQSLRHLMSGRNLLDLLERHSTFPDGLETESGTRCNDPGGGAWFGRKAEQSHSEPMRCAMGCSCCHTEKCKSRTVRRRDSALDQIICVLYANTPSRPRLLFGSMAALVCDICRETHGLKHYTFCRSNPAFSMRQHLRIHIRLDLRMTVATLRNSVRFTSLFCSAASGCAFSFK